MFQTLPLSGPVAHAIADKGFTQPTPVQLQTIPLILQGRDVIGRSQTGTGKTLAFGIPAVECIQPDGGVQVLVLCPTRELALQACEELEKLAKYKPEVRVLAVYGGSSMTAQLDGLRRGATLVVGTPGRVMDHLRRGSLRLDGLKMAVLDEADEMLNMGFREDIEVILQATPEDRQTVLFSATMPPPILALTKQYQQNPELVAIQRNLDALDAIEQAYFDVPRGMKQEALLRILRYYAPTRCIIFSNTRRMVDELCESLRGQGVKAQGLHGEMVQGERTRVMEGFKRGVVEVLIASDVAARGIDVEDVQVVINYDLPQNCEYYIHRIGRTGRAGKSGLALTLVCGKAQVLELKSYERQTRSTLTRLPLPTLKDVRARLDHQLAESIHRHLLAGEGRSCLPLVRGLMDRGHDPEEIAAAALARCLQLEGQSYAEDEVDTLAIAQAEQEARIRGDRFMGGRKDGPGRRQAGQTRAPGRADRPKGRPKSAERPARGKPAARSAEGAPAASGSGTPSARRRPAVHVSEPHQRRKPKPPRHD